MTTLNYGGWGLFGEGAGDEDWRCVDSSFGVRSVATSMESRFPSDAIMGELGSRGIEMMQVVSRLGSVVSEFATRRGTGYEQLE